MGIPLVHVAFLMGIDQCSIFCNWLTVRDRERGGYPIWVPLGPRVLGQEALGVGTKSISCSCAYPLEGLLCHKEEKWVEHRVCKYRSFFYTS